MRFYRFNGGFGARLAMAALASTVLAACVSIDDFRRYSPEQRAQVVCQRQASIVQLDAQLDGLRQQHAHTRAALDRGYHVHRQCRLIPGRTQEVCESREGRQVCKTSRVSEDREVCTETPVAMDAAFETAKLNAQANDIVRLARARDTNWQSCFAHVIQLSPEAAFAMR
jgi:homoserine acetyltransferase